MSPMTRSVTKHAKARQRRRRTAQERLARDRRQAQRAAEALQQALDDLGLPEDLVAELEGRLRSQHKLLGKIVGMMCPPLFGCRTNSELCRVRGWAKNLPSRLLGARPKRSWIKRLRLLSGIDGVLLVVVIGDGKLVVPVDFAIRRPDPQGPGAPCCAKLRWVQGMLDGRLAALRRRGVALPPPMVVADSGLSDSKLMRHVATTHEGTFLVEGKSTYTFALPDGRQVKGSDLQQPHEWAWRHSAQAPGVHYVRLRATSPTYGAVTIIIVKEHRAEQYYVMGLETAISGPRLIRAWKRRPWIEPCFRTLKHLLATGACQVHNENAYYGHLVLRLMGSFVLFYTSRMVCKGRLTMEEIIFSLKHYWRFVDSEALELKALSQGVAEKAA
jgi:hypothetical protein